MATRFCKPNPSACCLLGQSFPPSPSSCPFSLFHSYFFLELADVPIRSRYERWSHCPPRAGIGRRDAVYGTSDHLILLLGRVADFAARDQRRKRMAMELGGGRWRPSSGAGASTPQQATPPPGSATSAGEFVPPPPTTPTSVVLTQHGSPTYGMIPSAGLPRMPPAFRSAGYVSPASSGCGDYFELEVAAAAAEDEWKDIHQAMTIFEQSLGPEFHPLSAEHVPPRVTPFGTSLHYRSYPIACIWALYFCTHIVLQRTHPSMSAMAMTATGIAAPKTARYANDIGRISAGLFPTDLRAPLNATLSAALCETSLTLFFAGVQYQDPAQRAWTANSLRSISQRTGWESITAIAAGCEMAWTKAAKMGCGPPYSPSADASSRDDRIAMRGSYLTAGSTEDGTDHGNSYLNPGMRVHWAVGIFGIDEELQHTTLD